MSRRLGVVELPAGVEVALRVGARVILGAAILTLAFEAWRGNIPRDPEGGPLTEDVLVPAQVGLLVVAGVGLLLSVRWLAVAAALVATAGAGMGVMATLHYEPPFGFFVMAAFLVPAVMMWLDWQHRETLGKILVLAVGTAVILLVSWASASWVYARHLGPQHEQSETPALASSPVRWLWSGAVKPDGFTVTARLRHTARSVRLLVRDELGNNVASSTSVTVDDRDAAVKLTVAGLQPATGYGYAIEIDGEVDEVNTGRVSTFGEGAASITVAVASCAGTGSNGVVFDTIREQRPDLYIVTGDLHYRNIDDNSVSQFRTAFARVHDSASQSALYRSTPIAYVWDDHDYGPNDSDASSASRPAAWAAYRESVPHYDLAAGATGPIHQAFTIGRVRFVLTDTRSERDPDRRTLLGDRQLAWFLDELLAARDSHALTVWVNSVPWIASERLGAGNWGGFADERKRIGEFLDDHDITNLVMLSGDAHMVAIDDGTNSGYGGHDGFPVLHAGALDRPGSIKGGPYSHGAFPGAGRFGLLEVADDGSDQIEVALVGMLYTGEELVRLERSFEVEPVRGSSSTHP